jgi:hypothetical protein
MYAIMAMGTLLLCMRHVANQGIEDLMENEVERKK